MGNNIYFLIFGKMAPFALVCGLSAQAIAETVTIGGTGAGMGTMTLVGKAFEKLHPEHSIKVLPSLGSSGGIKALQSRALQIAVSNRDVTPEEKAAGLAATRYGTTAFVFVGHAKTPSLALTKEKIADIYSGKQQSWSNGETIRVVLRPVQDADTKSLNKISPAVAAAVSAAGARSGMIVAITDTESADHIEKTPNAFGTSTLALLLSENRDVNLFSLDRVKPSVQSINDGSYPYTKEMYVVVTASPSTGTRQFLQFIGSPQGAAILKKTGHRTTERKSG